MGGGIEPKRPVAWRFWLDVALRIALLVLWVTSLTLPAAWAVDFGDHWNHTHGPVLGFDLLLVGWMAMLDGQFGWSANMLLFPALIGLGSRPSRRRLIASTIVFALLALCLADSFFWHELRGAEDEVFRPYGPGRLLWLAAMAGAVLRSGILSVSGWRSWTGHPGDPVGAGRSATTASNFS